MSTAIQWTDVTDNIIRVAGGGWWCRKISPGCAHCYAEQRNQNTFFNGNQLAYTGQPPQLELQRRLIAGWTRQTTTQRHFVSSMTDVFGEWVPQKWCFEFLDGMAAAPLQTFQVLTKRADVMRQRVTAWLFARGLAQVPAHIWLGISVENQATADQRIPELLGIPAAVRFLSCEPLLGPIDLNDCGCGGAFRIPDTGLTGACGQGIDWVIIGGESGPNARSCNLDWIGSLVAQCQAADVATFVKQLGALPVTDNANLYDWATEPKLVAHGDAFAACRLVLKDKKGGDLAEFPDQLKFRDFPLCASVVK